MSWGRNVLVALDQGLNALFGGHPDETLSARWGRTRESNRVAALMSRILDKIDKDHAWDAIEFTPDGAAEPHHLGDYEVRRIVEEAAARLALERDDLTDEAMGYAEQAFKRQRLREAARDKARGGLPR